MDTTYKKARSLVTENGPLDAETDSGQAGYRHSAIVPKVPSLVKPQAVLPTLASTGLICGCWKRKQILGKGAIPTRIVLAAGWNHQGRGETVINPFHVGDAPCGQANSNRLLNPYGGRGASEANL